MGTAQQHLLSARFKYGVKDYNFGNHPAWEFFRIVYQMTKPPLAIGGIALAAGYTWASMIRRARPVSKELVAFSRREQMQRLKNFFAKRFSPKSAWARTN
jgi:biofilm PGA synthesis N-glycosyltransferase PgaC